LFGSVNVEAPGSKWYRSQVTKDQLIAATRRGADGSPVKTPIGQPVIDYEARFSGSTTPVLNMLKGKEIIYTDLNAIITDPSTALSEDCTDAPPSGTCGYPFREFTVIFHDELETGAPAFPELHQFVFHSVKDGFGINYGAAGLGSELLANRKRVGPRGQV
jgi:manganese oxidase